MADYEADTLERIKKLKHRQPGEISTPFTCNGDPCELVLLTSGQGADSHLMELLGRWRQENEAWFPAQFKVTLQGTTSWFNNGVIGATDRLLFLIKVRGTYVGHVGLFRFDFEQRTCEIDNILRGESGYPGIIHDAIIAMMKWGAGYLGLEGYTLQVLADNERAIRLYERLGYATVGKTPLIQVQHEGKVEWVKPPEGYRGEIQRHYAVMSLVDKSRVFSAGAVT